MNVQLLAAALGLVVATAPAFAQTPSAPAKDINAQKTDPMMMQESAPPDWTMLKGQKNGSIGMNDVAPNSWLAANFKSCDTNSDGKVSQAEYSACQKMAAKP